MRLTIKINSNKKEMKEKQVITKEIAQQMKDSGVESLISLAKHNFPELFNEKWDENKINVNGEKYHLIERSVNNGFKVSHIAHDIMYAKLCYTYPTKELAQEEAKLFSLMQKMRHYTRWANQQDNFVPDWSDVKQNKLFIEVLIDNIRVYASKSIRNGLFQCHFKTKERAQECIDIFGKEIIEVFNLDTND